MTADRVSGTGSTRPRSAGWRVRLRHLVKRIPGAGALYGFARLWFAPTLREDGLATVHSGDFVREPRFVEAYAAAEAVQGPTRLRWRARVLQWAASHALTVPGDFVECGVNRGFLSMSVAVYTNFGRRTDRRFFLVDTFSGLVESQVSPEDRAAFWNEYGDTYDAVVASFRRFPNVTVVRGVVPECLPAIPTERVAYLSIDMNCAAPELAALEFFWPKMVPGGVIVLDDYGFAGHEAQKRVADAFAHSHGVDLLPLPTGQGLLLKPGAEPR